MTVAFGHKLDDPYVALARLPAGLMLDVGAAVGHMSRSMRRRSPQSRVIAFEPNSANWPHFDRTNGADDQVTLIKAAVGDKAGALRFSTAQKIVATEGKWAQYAGGSSIGKVAEDGDIEVPVVTIDDTIGNQEVIFCKIDVQGFEGKVLQGAQRAIRERRIKVLLVEFMLYPEIFPLLEGYTCFSQEWTVIPRTNKKLPPPDMSSWDIGEEKQLSTGKASYKAWPKTHPHDPIEFTSFQRDENAKIGRCWTDLIFVAPDFVETFLAAAMTKAAT
ncbi:MAG: FkbM family methyltransferase [Hyphomonadaceae bacterium]